MTCLKRVIFTPQQQQHAHDNSNKTRTYMAGITVATIRILGNECIAGGKSLPQENWCTFDNILTAHWKGILEQMSPSPWTKRTSYAHYLTVEDCEHCV